MIRPLLSRKQVALRWSLKSTPGGGVSISEEPFVFSEPADVSISIPALGSSFSSRGEIGGESKSLVTNPCRYAVAPFP